MSQLRSFLRSVQTSFPILQPLRWEVERGLRRAIRLPHDVDWNAFLLLDVAPGPIVDVGANRGQSIESFLLTVPNRSMVCFEPNTTLARQLKSRYAHRANVRIHPVALGHREGNFTLYVPVYKQWMFDGLASLDRDEAMNWLNPATVWNFDPRHLRCIEMECRTMRLDSLKLDAAILKMDVQGTEISVLMGAESTIRKHQPIVFLESATDEIRDFLDQFGYRPYGFSHNHLELGRMDRENCFFLTEAHLRPTTGEPRIRRRFRP